VGVVQDVALIGAGKEASLEDSSRHSRRPSDRRELIVLSVRAEGFLSIADRARKLAVSHMTIRRDLQHLERTGQVRVVYGGVSLALPALHESNRWISHDVAEMHIGRCAAALVGEADTIAIDAGRLGYEIARALPEQFRGTVVTHSIPVIQLLISRPRPPRVVGLGGEVMARISAFVGTGTAAAAEGVRVRTFFLAPAALDDRGAYAHFDAEASVQRALLSVADKRVVVARHSCFTDSAPLLLGMLDRLEAVVTDQRPPDTMERALRRTGVHVLVAKDGVNTAVSANGRRHLSGPVQPGLQPEAVVGCTVAAGGSKQLRSAG
jgi:DeoR/GlpR family transcriptional regulator of sugar metabolism